MSRGSRSPTPGWAAPGCRPRAGAQRLPPARCARSTRRDRRHPALARAHGPRQIRFLFMAADDEAADIGHARESLDQHVDTFPGVEVTGIADRHRSYAATASCATRARSARRRVSTASRARGQARSRRAGEAGGNGHVPVGPLPDVRPRAARAAPASTRSAAVAVDDQRSAAPLRPRAHSRATRTRAGPAAGGAAAATRPPDRAS